jgi:hypothetical protein
MLLIVNVVYNNKTNVKELCDCSGKSVSVTHGCIVATLKLYLPDGKEAKAR